jgi:hypothetical protein
VIARLDDDGHKELSKKLAQVNKRSETRPR